MAAYKETFTTPVGRIVQGDVFEMQTKDAQGAPRVVKTGPNMGQPAPQAFIAVAFPKTYAALEHEMTAPGPDGLPGTEFGRFYALIDKVSRVGWPQFFPGPGPCVRAKFSTKVRDGDGIDDNGKANASKEGFAGHWIVSFASAYLPKVFRPASPGVWETVTDPKAVRRGYFVRVAGSISSNENLQQPGVYVNLDAVEFIAYGAEIVGGIDAATAFGAPVTLPPGASTVPLAGAATPMAPPPVPGVPVPVAGAPVPYTPPTAGAVAPVPYTPPTAGAVAPVAYTPPPTVTAPPAAPVVPNTTYMAPPPPPPVSIAGHTMTAAAGGQTREAFHAAGWSDDQLIANGYMIA